MFTEAPVKCDDAVIAGARGALNGGPGTAVIIDLARAAANLKEANRLQAQPHCTGQVQSGNRNISDTLRINTFAIKTTSCTFESICINPIERHYTAN